MNIEDKRRELEMLVKCIEAMGEEKQQFVLGFIAGVSASQAKKSA